LRYALAAESNHPPSAIALAIAIRRAMANRPTNNAANRSAERAIFRLDASQRPCDVTAEIA